MDLSIFLDSQSVVNIQVWFERAVRDINTA